MPTGILFMIVVGESGMKIGFKDSPTFLFGRKCCRNSETFGLKVF
jgi:hypothetical protein